MSNSSQRAPRIAVIGSGPSGCFLAGALRRSLPEAEITVLDRLPCPFGLVRYGVAADHQSTKAISRQFDRLFTRENINFAGNVYINDSADSGSLPLTELQQRADAVVLATGLAADRPLGLEGEQLPGVIGAGAVTRLLNSHPDDERSHALLGGLGESVAILGLGNVAVDLIRFLTKQAKDFTGSDINDAALSHYHRGSARRVYAFSRSPLGAAKCDAAMIRELGQIEGLRVELHGDLSPSDHSELDRTQAGRAQALHELAESTAQLADPRIELHLHFGEWPRAILGDNRARSLQIWAAHGESEPYNLKVTSVISAIGFTADEHTPDIGQDPAMPDSESGRIEPGLYRVGWLRRGPRGTIPENRGDALAVAKEIVADFESGAIPLDDSPEHSLPATLLPEAVARTAISYKQWLRVDQHELARAAEDRSRSKVASREAMLSIATADS